MNNDKPFLFQWRLPSNNELRYTLVYAQTPELAYNILIASLAPNTSTGTITNIQTEYQITFSTIITIK